MSDAVMFPAERWDDDRPEENFTLFAISPNEAAAFYRGVRELAEAVPKMAQMIMRMQARLDEIEEKRAQVTLSHADVKAVNALIRARAGEFCGKYGITDPGSLRSIGNGIRRAVLARYGVKDLHDVPAIARQAVEAQISRWTDMRLMMKCRERARAGGC